MKRVSKLVILSLIVSGCSLSIGSKQDFSSPQPDYLIHTVRFSGETLGAIASWYTGNSNNWSLILKHNPGLDVRSIRIGQPIKIPKDAARTIDPLPARFLKPKLLLVSSDSAGDYQYPD